MSKLFKKASPSLFFSGEKKSETKEKPHSALRRSELLDTSISCAHSPYARKVFWKGEGKPFFKKGSPFLFFSGEKKSETKEKPHSALRRSELSDISISCAHPPHARKVFWKGEGKPFFKKGSPFPFFSGEKKSETKEKPHSALRRSELLISPSAMLTPPAIKVFEVGFGEKLFSKSSSPTVSKKNSSREVTYEYT